MEKMNERVKEIEAIIHAYMPPTEGPARTVLAAMNYTMDAGGKRLRPMLMQETYRMLGGDGKVVEPFMAAIEMIHTYSLIHDDLPALDNDDYRRGRKTAHKVYGEDMAILAGDALLNYAYETAAKAFTMTEDLPTVVRAYTILTQKPGIYGMIGGQTVDVELTGKPMTEEIMDYIYANKTGALIEASMMIGAILAGASTDTVVRIEKLAGMIGLAFQIQDDILDIAGTEAELGKPLHSDEENGKTTYVTLHGMEQAKAEVERLSQEAVVLLDDIPGENPFLRELILSLMRRRK
ncbi:MAG: polyprenyl synthetase family protein [Bacteroides sp.]|nr:polyprenyl synthetase family protein [Bacteroides sp.]MCM1548565.1 polyprenyl synthetase family protein [Clostridium sp.]